MARNRPLLVGCALLAACFGGDAGVPADTAPGGEQPAAPGVQQPSTPGATGAQESSLLRETFTYEGGRRDPFLSLLATADVGPQIQDLRLVSVVYDARYPARSVAVVRDVNSGLRHRLKQGMVLGRLYVTQIGPYELILTVREFGFERQETLTLRKRGETP